MWDQLTDSPGSYYWSLVSYRYTQFNMQFGFKPNYTPATQPHLPSFNCCLNRGTGPILTATFSKKVNCLFRYIILHQIVGLETLNKWEHFKTIYIEIDGSNPFALHSRTWNVITSLSLLFVLGCGCPLKVFNIVTIFLCPTYARWPC